MIPVVTIPLDKRRKVYVEDAGLKLQPQGKPQPPKEALAKLSKGERRRVRKALTAMGKGGLAKASL